MEIQINFNKDRFIAAKFGRVYGINGWLNIINFLSTSNNIGNFSKFYVNGVETKLMFKKKGKKYICKIEGINQISDAKGYVGKEISIEKQELPKLKTGQYYYNELLGMEVRINKKKIGEIIDIQNHGAGDYIIIQKQQNEILVPLINEHVLKIDPEKKILNLNPRYYEF